MSVKIDKMRYQTNKSAYRLILLGLSISMVAMFRIIIPVTVRPNYEIAIEILINIVLLLVTFLAAERCKIYSKSWAIASFVIAGVHVLRIFYVPRRLLERGMLTGLQFSWIAILLLATAVLIAAGGVITWIKHHQLQSHLSQVGE